MGYLVGLSILLSVSICCMIASSFGCGETYHKVINLDCDPSKAGQMKFTTGKIFVCDGKEWKALQYEESSLGSRRYPGFSCKGIKTSLKDAANGIYWITLSDFKNAFPVYCDMAAGGWTMVFKAVSGVDKKVYPTYVSPRTSSEKNMAALDVTNKHKDHYKNRIVLKWSDFGASEARVALYTGGQLVKELNFNAQRTNNLNWFSASKLIDSSWRDVKSESKNVFSISGLSRDNRNFFINKNYGGCSKDAGWMGITSNYCKWETRFLPRKNVILYSKLSGYTNWNQYNSVGVADVLVVYLL